MAVEHADNAIESFLELEQRFDDFVRAVPIAPEHNRVHSPLLASILLDACSLIETVLKSSMDNARHNGVNNIVDLRGRRYSQTQPYLNIGNLKTVFRPDMFYTKPVWYLPRGESSFPWYQLRTQNAHPRWWGEYNSVKHSRFENNHKATLLTTLHALKGLFLILVQSLEFRERLVERSIIRSDGLRMQQLRSYAVMWEPFHVAWQPPIVATTKLFGYKFLTDGSPQHAGEPTIFL